MPIQLSLAVVGALHPNRKGPARLFEIRMCCPGEPVQLIPEPGNPADPRAIAVFSSRNIQIGYLTAERAPWIGNLITKGKSVRAIFQQATKTGAVIRASLDGNEPILPTSIQPPLQLDPDFWPDWIPPDE